MSLVFMANSAWALPNLSSLFEKESIYKSDKNSYTFTTSKNFTEIQRTLSAELKGKWILDKESMKVEASVQSVLYTSVLEPNQKIWIRFKQFDTNKAMCEIAFIE